MKNAALSITLGVLWIVFCWFVLMQPGVIA